MSASARTAVAGSVGFVVTECEGLATTLLAPTESVDT
jgi:hypothetical protein